MRRTLPPRLGPYEVCAKIAGGGMATVHLGLGVDAKGNEQLVALKVINEAYMHREDFVAMFLDEAKILARIRHRHVLRTFDYGTSEGFRYIAMELLLGRPLVDAWELCATERTHLPLVLGAWILARVAEGLHAAHELADDAGEPLHVIHRDVNPSNVFLTYDGGVKLIDFGLAKARSRRSQSEPGIVKGKIPYLAPEQTRQGPIDRRVDLYGLGITLWELGTGRRLFKRDTDVGTLQAIREANVPDPRTLVLAYPEGLRKIVLRALQAEPDDRYQTAEEMRKDLDAFVEAAGEDDPKQALSAYLESLFPGEEKRQRAWLARASLPRARESQLTIPPPVPVGANAPASLTGKNPAAEPASSDPMANEVDERK